MTTKTKTTMTLDKALATFQSRDDVDPPVDSTNPHFKNDYASLEAVIHTCRKALEHNITFSQMIDFEVDTIVGNRHEFVITTITHTESGETKTSRCPLKVKDEKNPQAMGSAITYAKRYSLLAIFGLAVDDDAETATQQIFNPPHKKITLGEATGRTIKPDDTKINQALSNNEL
tara:strand:- start:6108 stop:6629 length:522 start_codon:yes stop_codon:yes gene_type:complete